MNKIIFFSCILLFGCKEAVQQQPKPRILISTDIGGTDPDDNQSMIHFLMYSNLFQTEGLVSSPSYGEGNKEEILKMIDLYEKDLPKLQKHIANYPTPASLRAVCKQGRKGLSGYEGYQTATEGSDWIVKCAKKESSQPLWVLVWGGLEDLAQALNDAPEIEENIKVYWIGGPNKKWSANSYAYIVENFPDLWFLEANAVYRGFFSNTNAEESLKNENYYTQFINGTGHMGASFKDYYKGQIKMGDTPSLLYLMHGEPLNPTTESWGGSFEKITHSPRVLFNRNTTLQDTIPVYGIAEYHIEGPNVELPKNTGCFTMAVKAGVGVQKWTGYYQGDGQYVIRYVPKKAETLSYTMTSEIPGFLEQSGQLVVKNVWPDTAVDTAYPLGNNWYADPMNPDLFDGGWQGANTVLKWRKDILLDWAERWSWLQEE